MPLPSSPPQSRPRPGFVALLSIIMISAIAASAVMILFNTGMTSVQNTADAEKSVYSRSLAEACMEKALESLRNGVPLSTPTTTTDFSRGSCTVTSITNTSGETWRLRSTGAIVDSLGSVTRYFEVYADKEPGSGAVLRSWQEKLSF